MHAISMAKKENLGQSLIGYTINAYDSTVDQESGTLIRLLAVKTEYSVPALCFMVTPRCGSQKSAGMTWEEELRLNIYKVLL